jgi:methionyl-tRNA formyltransferase
MEGLLKLAPNPRYIFFLHWSTRVPEVLLKSYECVCFHMADVPFGRGGSPLQNLIQLGIRETKLTALRMVEELDAGPTYLKRPMSLEGGAEEIYLRAGRISSEIIAEIIRDEPLPKPQLGEAVVFKRRKPAESKIPENIKDFVGLHDFIRMLDAAGYPHAFIEYGGFRFEFTRAALYGDRVDADVTITRVGERLSPQ